MGSIIVKNGRVGIVAGRVVTDAGGADCCCGPPGCGCDLSRTFVAYRAGCVGTPAATSPVAIAGGAQFGTITLRVTWRATYTFTSASTTDTLNAEGVGVLCVSGNTVAPLAIAGSSSRSSRVRTGSNPINVSAEYGPENWNRYIVHPTLTPPTALSFIGPRLQAAAFSPQNPSGPFGAIAFLRDFEGQGYGSLCNWISCVEGNPGCQSYLFTDSDAGGETRGLATYTSSTFGNGSASMTVTWTRDLSCRLGGSGILPIGIDPTTLRPYKTGCPSCGE